MSKKRRRRAPDKRKMCAAHGCKTKCWPGPYCAACVRRQTELLVKSWPAIPRTPEEFATWDGEAAYKASMQASEELHLMLLGPDIGGDIDK